MNLEDERGPASVAYDTATPLVSILLIAYNQAGVVADAVAGALAQTYSPLEILISDDASTDGTYAAIEAAVRDYRGPHRIVLNRNAHNEGITAHLSRLAHTAGVGDAMRALLAPKLARERYTRDVFAARGFGAKLGVLWRARGVKTGFKWRMFLYAACPSVYRPFFALRARAKRAR